MISLNQRVLGSSPSASTKNSRKTKDLQRPLGGPFSDGLLESAISQQGSLTHCASAFQPGFDPGESGSSDSARLVRPFPAHDGRNLVVVLVIVPGRQAPRVLQAQDRLGMGKGQRRNGAVAAKGDRQAGVLHQYPQKI